MDANANSISGGTATFYLSGTTTLATVYADADQTTPLANPLPADGGGLLADVYLNDSVPLRCVLKDAAGTTIKDIDPVNPSGAIAQQATRTGAEGLRIPVPVGYIQTAGYAQPGDGGAARYSRAASEPSHPGKFQTADGAWWELAEDEVTPAMFGLFTSATVTTATLRSALDYAVSTGKRIVCGGSHTVNGPITTQAITSGTLDLYVDKAWNITVDPAAPIFTNVLGFEADVASDFTLSGGVIKVNGNDRAGCAIYLRHLEAADGGTVIIDAPVEAFSLNGLTSTLDNGGIAVGGRFERVIIRSPSIGDITRRNAAGETYGISVFGFVGDVEIYSPVVKNIYKGAGSADADGIKCFGRQPSADPSRRQGRVRIYDPYFENCEGRSYKDQCGDTVIRGARVKRDGAVMTAIAQGVEFDFQNGGGTVDGWDVEYVGTASPLGGSHSIFAAQQIVTDAEMVFTARNGVVRSSHAIPRVVAHVTGDADTKATVTKVQGIEFVPGPGLTDSMVTRAVVEFDASKVVAKAAETSFVVEGVRGPLTCAMIGYTGYSSGDLSGKLSFAVNGCSTSLASVGTTRAISQLSGSQITNFKSFEMGENPGFRTWFAGWTIDFRKLRAGTRFAIDIGSSSFTNAPSWGSSGQAFIHCLGKSFYSTDSDDAIVEVRLNNATASPSAWFTQDGGANWGALN